jgi:RNA polymerase sigma-70 factor, ECF subfamily
MNDLVNIQPDLLRYAFSLTRNDSAYDLRQDANVRILEKIDLFSEDNNFRCWCFSIMYHLFIDQKRKEKPMNRGGEIKIVTKFDYDNFNLHKAIRNIIHEKTRQAIILRVKFGLKYREIYEVQQENINTIKARIRDGRKQILAQYEKN